jgi:hypothetical protein
MELLFRVLKTNSHDEVIATATSAAYDTAVSLWPTERIELRQARASSTSPRPGRPERARGPAQPKIIIGAVQ